MLSSNWIMQKIQFINNQQQQNPQANPTTSNTASKDCPDAFQTCSSPSQTTFPCLPSSKMWPRDHILSNRNLKSNVQHFQAQHINLPHMILFFLPHSLAEEGGLQNPKGWEATWSLNHHTESHLPDHCTGPLHE